MLDLAIDNRVAWLHLARPEALNALDQALTAALEEALERVAGMDDVSVLVVAGRGRAFCAGNDIREMAGLDPQAAEALAARQARLMDRFSRLPQVTLAAIDGYALGGGLMLAVAQDLRIASDRARFGLPEVTLGFNPAYGIARLLDVLGGGHARDLLLTGRTIRAGDALRMGLVNRVVAPPTLEASATALAAEIARLPRAGLSATKRLVAEIQAGERGHEPEAYGAALRTGEAARARIEAFVARRAARPAPRSDEE
jgi:enoyl-CoA hydratase